MVIKLNQVSKMRRFISCGVILRESCGINNRFRDLFGDNIFILSEYNIRGIVYKMSPKKKNGFGFEVPLADHCNLNCRFCTHFCSVARPVFLDFEQYKKDIARIRELTGGTLGFVRLIGGEPLLNERCADFIKITRQCFPDSAIHFSTNGLLLDKWENHPSGNIWRVFRDNEVIVFVSRYPVKLNYEALVEKSVQYGVSLYASYTGYDEMNEKYFAKHPLDMAGKQDAWKFISCYEFNECVTLRNGKIFPCIITHCIEHFNNAFGLNFEVTNDDYIDIYAAKSYEEIAAFVTRRVPFCNYCALDYITSKKWDISKKTADEYLLTQEDISCLSAPAEKPRRKNVIAWLKNMQRMIRWIIPKE